MTAQQLALEVEDPKETAWRRFHYENPQVYRELVAMARKWKASGGHWPIGIALFVNTLRYSSVTIHRTDQLRINDHTEALYSRHIMACEPDLDGFFTTRTRRIDRERP